MHRVYKCVLVLLQSQFTLSHQRELMNGNVHVKRIIWPATKALAMRKKNNPGELIAKKATKRIRAEEQHAQQFDFEDETEEEEPQTPSEDEDDEEEDNEAEVVALCSENINNMQGGDLSIPVSEEIEWEDKKSDVLFTSGPVSEECRSCNNPHVLYTIARGCISRKARLISYFFSFHVQYEVAFGERVSLQSKWPQVFVTKYYKSRGSSEKKSICLGVDAVHACAVGYGIIKAMEASPAKEHFTSWLSTEAVKVNLEGWRKYEVESGPAAIALQKAKLEVQKTKDKAALAKKKLELLKKHLNKFAPKRAKH